MTSPRATDRPTTFRQSPDQAQALELIARVLGVPVSEVMRAAIASHIRTLRSDPTFMARMRDRVTADQNILDQLCGGSDG